MKNGWGYEKDNGERADWLTVDLGVDDLNGDEHLLVVVCIQLQHSNSLLFLFIFGDWDREIRDVISEN